MTNKANSKLLLLRRNLKGCPEKLKQTAYFSLIRSFMEYGATVWDPYQKYNSDKIERVQRRAARFVKSRYSRYSSVSDMLDELGWMPLSQRRQEARLILFYKIINGLSQVPFEGVLVEAYNPNNMLLVVLRWQRQRTARDLSKWFSRGPPVAATQELS